MNHRETSNISLTMTTLAWLAALAFSAWLFTRYLDQQHNPNQNLDQQTASQDRSVVLQRNRQGHYLAVGYINGKKVHFLVDTGATHIAIPQGVADALRLKRMSRGRSITAAGTVNTFGTRLDQVRLGSIVLKDVRASINPYMEGDEILLGMSFLKDLELIQRGNTLTLRQY